MSKEKLDINGIITVLNTPFDENGKVDFEDLEKAVQFAIDGKVVGILAPALAAEVYKLSQQEKIDIVQSIVNIGKGKVKIIASVTANTLTEMTENAELFNQMDVDGILANIAFENEKQYRNGVEQIAQTNPKFLMLQDWDCGGYGIPSNIVKNLFEEIDCFKSFKIEVVPAGVKYSEIRDMTNGMLHICGGWAVTQMIEGLDRGVDAFMPTAMHKIYTKIYDLYKKGKRKNAQELFEKLLPVLAFSNQHLDISVHFFKKLMKAEAIFKTDFCRQPIVQFDKFHEKTACECIERVLKLENEINLHYNEF